MLARAAATATFTFVGNTWMASAAVPASTVFSGVVISSSVNSGVFFSDAGPLWVWISAVVLRLGHQGHCVQHIKAAHCAVRQVDAPAVGLGRGAGLGVKIGIRKSADADGDKAQPGFQHRQTAFFGHLHGSGLHHVIRFLGQHLVQGDAGCAARFGAQGLGVRQLSAHRCTEV